MGMAIGPWVEIFRFFSYSQSIIMVGIQRIIIDTRIYRRSCNKYHLQCLDNERPGGV